MLKEHMRANLLWLPVREVTHAGTRESKADRIAKLEPFYKNHAVFHCNHLKGGVLEEQLLRFKPGGGVHDDYPDALAMALEVVRDAQTRRTADGPNMFRGEVRYPSTGY
jgi:hypothetical protein